MLAGVCGGIADSLGWDPTLVRILYVVLSVTSAAFPGILTYLVLWMVMPTEDRSLVGASGDGENRHPGERRGQEG